MVGMTKFKKFKNLSIFLLPNLLGTILFLIVPILSSFALSFTDWDLLGEIKFIGLENYQNVFRDEKFYASLLHTVLFILGYLPFVLVISLGIAILLNQKLKGVKFFRALHFLPVITSWVAVSMIWMWILNPKYGLLNYGLSLIGIQGPAWLTDPKYALISVIITSVWKDIGFLMVIFLSGLQNIPTFYYEAAQIDGANAWKRFTNVTLPLLTPTTFFAIIISLINSFQVFDQIYVMTEGGPAGATSVLVEQIYKNAISYYKMGYASAYAMVLFVIIFTITAIQRKIERSMSYYEN